MKRLLAGMLATMVLTFASFATAPVLAVDIFNQPGGACSGEASSSAACQDVKAQGSSTQDPVVHYISIAIHIIAFIIGLASVIIIIVSGIRMVVSNGDSQAFATARNAILYALVGIVVVIFAEALVAFVLSRL